MRFSFSNIKARFFSSAKGRALLWIPPLLFLTIFFFFPLFKIFNLAFDLRSVFERDNLQIIYRVSLFTFYQATLSTLLTFALGLPSAVLFSKFSFKGKSLLRALTAVPFMLPAVVVAAAFNSLFSYKFSSSIFQVFNLQPATFNFLLILLAHTFYNTTIVVRIVGNALAQLDPRMEASARVLGADGFRVGREIIFPLLRPALISSALLVFMFDFTSFGVILLLGGLNFATLEVEIYVRALQLPNLNLAALLSAIQLIFTLIFSMLYSRLINKMQTQSTPRFAPTRPPKTVKEKIFVGAMCGALFVFFLLPLISLPVRSLTRLEADRGQRGAVQYGLTADYYRELFVNRRGSLFYVPPVQAAVNSLGFAALTVLFSLALGHPAAYALAKPTRFEKILDPLLTLPLGASAVMMGLGFLLSFGRLIASPIFIPIAHTLVALPFVIRALQPALASVPERLRQAAATLGASPFRVWQTVDFPILSRAAASAAAFAFTVSLGEFGATLLITRPEYPTIPVAIARFLSQPGGLNYGQATAMATLLLILTTLSILIIEKMRFNNVGEW
ncbi:MAG: iron ABC transporter permease [Anaerolineales bacterium]|nr:iron ABC transporter permease [Anaerolineales bacterium]